MPLLVPSPAVVSTHRPLGLPDGQGKSNLKERGNSARPGHANEERMEIGAISLPDLTNVGDITSPPTVDGLVVSDIVEHALVNAPSLFLDGFHSLRRLTSPPRHLALQRHEAITLQGPGADLGARLALQAPCLVPPDVQG